MKKRIAYNVLCTVLAVICAAALVATCAEYPDGSIGLWNIIALTVFAVSAYALDKVANLKTN